MKNVIIIPVIAGLLMLLAIHLANANDKYTEAMKKNIQAVYEAKTIADLQNAVNAFERIGGAEKSKWEPYYYAAFGYVMMATREQDAGKKDSYLDLALKALTAATSLKQNDSEIVALEGFVHMIRVTVDPAARGQQYSSMAFQVFNKAVGINPDNPRALALLAQMQYGTAQFFGSPTTEACATLTKSLEKFDNYKAESEFAPLWGRSMAEGMKTKCQ
jgi:tetratricopeptide (TPR) repeat protein